MTLNLETSASLPGFPNVLLGVTNVRSRCNGRVTDPLRCVSKDCVPVLACIFPSHRQDRHPYRNARPPVPSLKSIKPWTSVVSPGCAG